MGASSSGMKYFFEPRSIAVAGASTDQSKLGSIIFSNLLERSRHGVLKATVYPINPAHDQVLGQPCYSRVGEVPEVPDLLVVAVPAQAALEVVKDAAEAGAKCAVIIAGGFSEVGRAVLEREVLDIARRSGMRILGPNTMGLVDTRSGVDTLFFKPTKRLASGKEVPSVVKPLRGDVVIITQSGHFGQILSEGLAVDGVGIRAMVGTGNQLDVSAEDVIGYFAKDDSTRAFAVYLEGLKDGRKFMRIASAVAKSKPIVVYKAGKVHAGARAALTHTASLVGDYDVYKAAFRDCGIVEAEDLQELADMAAGFSLLPHKAGHSLLIVTNAGGVAAVAADEAERSGLKVAPLSAGTAKKIRSRFAKRPFLTNASLNNPLDVTASASASELAEVVSLALASDQYDMALVLPTHQTPAIGPEVSELVSSSIKKTGKPVCVCVMGEASLSKIIHSDFLRQGILSFPTPERAVRALAALSAHSTLSPSARGPASLPGGVETDILSQALRPMASSKLHRLLGHYGVSRPKEVLVKSKDELGKTASLRFPLACKLISQDLVHKTEAGGVILDVADVRKVADAFLRLSKIATHLRIHFDGLLAQEMASGIELLLGGTRDKTFGPTVTFGSGGTNAEVLRDYSVAVAPVDARLARAMIMSTKVGRALSVHRDGGAVDVGRLSRLIARFSKILIEDPSIAQIEVNPLIASRRNLLAVDSRAAFGEPVEKRP